MIDLRAPASAGSKASAAPGFSAASSLAGSMSATMIFLSVSARGELQAHHADAAEADDQERPARADAERFLEAP